MAHKQLILHLNKTKRLNQDLKQLNRLKKKGFIIASTNVKKNKAIITLLPPPARAQHHYSPKNFKLNSIHNAYILIKQINKY